MKIGLKNKPDTTDLDPNLFIVLDRKATEQTIVVCKIGDRVLKGESLDYLRFDTKIGANFLLGLEPGNWEQRSGNGRKSAEIDYWAGA